MAVLLIDYGMGNLLSVKRSFEECGADVVISDDPASLKVASHIVLPGVGSFADAMHNIRMSGWYDAIRREVMEEGIPFLGICLGMQLLATKGFEGGETEGLGLVPGEIRKLVPDTCNVRIPHVGWNEVHQSALNPLLAGIPDGTDFYFVHSFHFIPSNPSFAVGRTPYCGGFVSVVMNEKVFGVQFHPEKSQKSGFRMIRNFLSMS